ncbi:MAG: hypothetical protein PHW52_02435 [Candidatus Pacebacteria bacterium]|nr:hypothetical protein [Candidatus Paceibacterota bacterium]
MQIYDDFWNLGYYRDYTVENLDQSNRVVQTFFPFIERVLPRIAEVQESQECLNLICFNNKIIHKFRGCNDEIVWDECRGVYMERILIRFGLEPLITSKLLTDEEGGHILLWFERVLDSPQVENFSKHIECNGIDYTLLTDRKEKQRRFCLTVGHIQTRI